LDRYWRKNRRKEKEKVEGEKRDGKLSTKDKHARKC